MRQQEGHSGRRANTRTAPQDTHLESLARRSMLPPLLSRPMFAEPVPAVDAGRPDSGMDPSKLVDAIDRATRPLVFTLIRSHLGSSAHASQALTEGAQVGLVSMTQWVSKSADDDFVGSSNCLGLTVDRHSPSIRESCRFADSAGAESVVCSDVARGSVRFVAAGAELETQTRPAPVTGMRGHRNQLSRESNAHRLVTLAWSPAGRAICFVVSGCSGGRPIGTRGNHPKSG